MSVPSAWIFQVPSQVAKHGTEAASWYVGWYTLDGKRHGKSFGPGVKGKDKAERFRRKKEGELEGGKVRECLHKTWDEFRAEYETRIADGMTWETRRATLGALDRFKKAVKVLRVSSIGTQTIDDFIAARRQERGKKKGAGISAATINKDLRHLKAALTVAVDWGYLPVRPKFKMLREVKDVPTYVTPEHFRAIYQACDVAKLPTGLPYPPADWWRALLALLSMTGWRVGQAIALRRPDLDLDTGEAITRGDDNKGRRSRRIKLHPFALDHLRELASFDDRVLPWNRSQRRLHEVFATIQEAAGIHLPCSESHEHTRFCHVYGFHDLRRAFATMNADRLTPDALQELMQHRAYQTTQVYINMARQIDQAVSNLYVPDVAGPKLAGGEG